MHLFNSILIREKEINKTNKINLHFSLIYPQKRQNNIIQLLMQNNK